MSNQEIKRETVDFAQLIRSSECGGLTLQFRSKLLDQINLEFTEEEQTWFVANFYVYLQYHPTRDFPIKLDNIWDMIGFSTKANAKRTLKNNFVEDEDYKIVFIRRDENPPNPSDENLGGRPEETILLNVDTFKNLCMLTKTEKSKKIRKYYIKLEGLLNGLIKEQKEEYETKIKQLETENDLKEKLLEEKEKLIETYETTPDIEGFSSRQLGQIYMAIEIAKQHGYHIKFGMADNSESRLSSLNVSSSMHSIKLYKKFPTFDKNMAEKMVHHALQPFRIKNRKEWFFFKNDHELAYAIDTIKKILDFINQFDIKNYTHFKEIIQTINPDNYINDETNNICENIEKKNNEILSTHHRQLYKTKTKNPVRKGTFRGVSWCSNNQLWCAQIQNNYKHEFLGYFADEIDGAKIYNDYALYLNQTKGTTFALNDIPGYRTVPRNIPELMKKEKEEKKSSKWRGVSYDSKRKHFVAGIQLTGKTYNLGNSLDENECGFWYDCQALYFNNTLGTTYQLNNIPGYTPMARNIHAELTDSTKKKKTSKYIGVSKTAQGKWACSYMMNRKKIHIGTFETEDEACREYNQTVSKLNEQGFNYKVNQI